MKTFALVVGCVALLVGCGGGGGGGDDSAVLRVTQTSPAASAANTPLTTTVSVDFSEEAARETLDTTSFVITQQPAPSPGGLS